MRKLVSLFCIVIFLLFATSALSENSFLFFHDDAYEKASEDACEFTYCVDIPEEWQLTEREVLIYLTGILHGYDYGWDDGWDKGWDEGYSDGHSDGYWECIHEYDIEY